MIYGLADLHLDITKEKDMKVFGEVWEDYEEKIFRSWKELVKPEDLVLVPGDISWAMTLEEAKYDLDRVDALPGTKVILRGNHDYWWQSLKKIREMGFQTIHAVQNNAFEFGDYVICGTRGWNPRDSADFTEQDEKIFFREMNRLILSLKEGMKIEKEIIAMLHYPPFNRDKTPNEMTEILREFGVKTCVYGHLHSDGLKQVVEGNIDGIEYHCISADYLQFRPKLIKKG